MSAYEQELTCRHCGVRCESRRKRRDHRCPERDVAERIGSLRWPIAPIERYLTVLLGEYDQNTNPDGYCATAVERVSGFKASTWKKLAAEGGSLSDAQADRIATALAVPPVAFWGDWYRALDVTDQDHDWLDRWSRGVA